MNPTIELVGTVVGEPEVVTLRGFWRAELEIETRIDYGDVHGEIREHRDRFRVTIEDGPARERRRLRAGSRWRVAGRLVFATYFARRTHLEVAIVADSLEQAAATDADRQEVFVLGRLLRVRMLTERQSTEPCRFQLTPILPAELGLRDVSSPTGLLDGFAFGDHARELEGLPDDTLVALCGRLSSYERHSTEVPSRSFVFAAEGWG